MCTNCKYFKFLKHDNKVNPINICELLSNIIVEGKVTECWKAYSVCLGNNYEPM